MSEIVSTEAIDILNNAITSLQSQKSAIEPQLADLDSQTKTLQAQADSYDKAISDISGVITYLQTPVIPPVDPANPVPPAGTGIVVDQAFLDTYPQAVAAGFTVGDTVDVDASGNITEEGQVDPNVNASESQDDANQGSSKGLGTSGAAV